MATPLFYGAYDAAPCRWVSAAMLPGTTVEAVGARPLSLLWRRSLPRRSGGYTRAPSLLVGCAYGEYSLYGRLGGVFAARPIPTVRARLLSIGGTCGRPGRRYPSARHKEYWRRVVIVSRRRPTTDQAAANRRISEPAFLTLRGATECRLLAPPGVARHLRRLAAADSGEGGAMRAMGFRPRPLSTGVGPMFPSSRNGG